MVQVIVTGHDGQSKTVNARPSATLMETIRDAGLSELLALCGGCCSCATCHVYVDPAHVDRLPRMSADEDALLESSSQRRETSRLSCQVSIDESLDGLRVTIAPHD